MTNSLFNNKKQIFSDVIRLAENWSNANDSSGFDGGTIGELLAFQDTVEGQKINALANELREYLQSLDFDDIKMLQIVMYLGRDQDYDTTLSPDLNYEDQFNYFENKGWSSKDIEINQMTHKLPLAEYLKSGLDILQVSV